MGTIERGLDAPTVFVMDQVEAGAEHQLRELAEAQKVLSDEYGDDTTPLILAIAITESAEKRGDSPEYTVIRLSHIVGIATKILVQLGWPDNEKPVPVTG